MEFKENAIKNFKNMIIESWTFNRFTSKEKENFNNMLYCMESENRLIGNYNQRWNQLNNIYQSFLSALDYKPIGWRE